MLTGPRALLGLSCVIVLSASCSSEPRGAEGAKSTPTPRAEVRTVHAPVDVGNVRRDPALAFRRVGSSILSSSETFDASVTAGGSIVVMPKDGSANAVAPLELETVSIVRGSHVLTTRTSAGVDARGAVTIARGEVEEKIDNDDVALEQSWSFRDRPSGEGDLVVRVRASGEAFRGTTAHGLHFSERDLGLRYGTGTWIDADGKRTEIAPTFENGEIILRVPNDVVASARYPAILDPTVTMEKEIDKPGAPGAALGDRSYPLVASSRSNDRGYVAAWYDRRGIRPALYASRTTTNGTPTADVGNVVANGVTPSTTPFLAAAPNGGGYLLVWAVASYDPFLAPGVYAVRLGEDGAPIDKSPVAVADNQGYVYSLSAAFDGTNWLVAWQRYNSSTYYDIGGARLSKDGQRLDAKPIEISKSSSYEYNPVVESIGNGFFVGWRASPGGLQGRLVGSDGSVTAPTVTVHPSTLANDFRLASGNNQYAFAWTESGNVYAKRLDGAGTVLDAGAISINVEASFSDSRPRIVWDGTSYVVAFYRSTTPMPSILAHRLGPAGNLIDATPFTIATSSYLTDVAMASDGTGTILINREYYGATNVPYRYEIRSWATSKPNATPAEVPQTTGPNLLSKGAPSETEPAVVWNGARHQAVWLDQRDTAMTIYGASMDRDGVASGAKVLLANPGAGGAIYSQLTRPRIAANGANGFLVVFYAQEQVAATTRRGVFGLVLDSNGNVTGGVREIAVTPTNAPAFIYEREPDVAFDGKNYFVVWQQETSEGYAIAGRRVDANGAVVDTKESLRLTAVSSTQLRTTPSVAFDGSTYFVAWVTSRQTTSINVTHIYGSRVNKDDLSPLDGELAICEKFLLQRAPHVSGAPNGGFFVVWEDNRNSLEAADIYATRITPQGAIADGADGIQVATGAHDEARPRAVLTGDGTNWVVAWRDLRSKQTYDIYGAWVSRAGKVHDREGFLLSAEGGDEEAPTLTAPQDAKLVLTYQRLDPAAGSYRLRSRAIDGGKLVAAPCASNDECASRSCVDGVCCENECGGCGVCNVTPGKCTPRGAGFEAPACKNYKCQEGVACPTECKSDADCSANATCDPGSNTCVSLVICIDNHTLRDLTNKTTDCAPYSCVGEACRTNCGSVDDCAAGFVCDLDSRCVRPPESSDGGCATGSSPVSNLGLVAIGAFFGLAAVRRRRAPR